VNYANKWRWFRNSWSSRRISCCWRWRWCCNYK
jgi:hypothetical protein